MSGGFGFPSLPADHSGSVDLTVDAMHTQAYMLCIPQLTLLEYSAIAEKLQVLVSGGSAGKHVQGGGEHRVQPLRDQQIWNGHNLASHEIGGPPEPPPTHTLRPGV